MLGSSCRRRRCRGWSCECIHPIIATWLDEVSWRWTRSNGARLLQSSSRASHDARTQGARGGLSGRFLEPPNGARLRRSWAAGKKGIGGGRAGCMLQPPRTWRRRGTELPVDGGRAGCMLQHLALVLPVGGWRGTLARGPRPAPRDLARGLMPPKLPVGTMFMSLVSAMSVWRMSGTLMVMGPRPRI